MTKRERKLADFDILDSVSERGICQRCQNASRKYFCYTCYQPMPAVIDRLPQVQLPINVHIVRHPGEKSGKSTGVHCAVLAPTSVQMFVFPKFPDYRNRNVLLIYPDRSAPTLQQLMDGSRGDPATIRDQLKQIEAFIIIDCTWFQTAGIRKHKHFQDIKMVALGGYSTDFWRPQHKMPAGCLATVEALYYFCIEFQQFVLDQPYNGQFDNLLYFFEYFKRMVHKRKSERQKSSLVVE